MKKYKLIIKFKDFTEQEIEIEAISRTGAWVTALTKLQYNLEETISINLIEE